MRYSPSPCTITTSHPADIQRKGGKGGKGRMRVKPPSPYPTKGEGKWKNKSEDEALLHFCDPALSSFAMKGKGRKKEKGEDGKSGPISFSPCVFLLIRYIPRGRKEGGREESRFAAAPHHEGLSTSS